MSGKSQVWRSTRDTADMIAYGWVRSHAWAGIEDLSAFPLMTKWMKAMEDRKGIYNGLGVPVRPKKMTKEEEEEMAKEASKWVMKDHDKQK